VRAAFAEQLLAACGISNERLLRAFTAVPREAFLPAPPWRLLSLDGTESSTSDPTEVHRDVLVALDADRMLFNGSPRLWAGLFHALDLREGERIAHVGTGAGYYTAILAEIVGARGTVLGFEIDPGLAERAEENLRAWPQVSSTCGDGAEHPREPVDVIVVNAGATHVVDRWLDALRPGGRLYAPLTVEPPGPAGTLGIGVGMIVRREADRFSARFAGPVMIFHCSSARAPKANAALADALQSVPSGAESVRSLRRDPHAREADCWCHIEGRCLSFRTTTSEPHR